MTVLVTINAAYLQFISKILAYYMSKTPIKRRAEKKFLHLDILLFYILCSVFYTANVPKGTYKKGLLLKRSTQKRLVKEKTRLF